MDLRRWMRNQLDRTAALLLAAAGLVAIFIGWLGVSSSLLPSQQIPYLASGGLLGLFLLGAGATIWLSADLRDEWRKLDELVGEVREASSRQIDEPHTADLIHEGSVGAASNGSAAKPRRVAPLQGRSDA